MCLYAHHDVAIEVSRQYMFSKLLSHLSFTQGGTGV